MNHWTEQWMSFHALLLFPATLLLFYTANLVFLAIPASLGFGLLFIWYALREKSLHFVFQPANLVTTFRLASLLYLSFAFSTLAPLTIGLIALGVLMLDGLDGFLARRFKTASDFGKYLDMETDAFYVLSLGAILYQMDYLGAWILIPGLLRYGYFLILKMAKPPEQKELRVTKAQVIGVILMFTLAACFILPSQIHQPAIVMATLLVFYSFGDGFWQACNAHLKHEGPLPV